MMKKLPDKDRQRIRLPWKTIATDLGLTYEDADHPSLSGKWEDRDLSMKVYRETSGRVSQVVTHFELGNRYIFNTSFQLTRQGFLQDMMGKVGSEDVQIGDQAFDDAVLVKGWNETAVQTLLRNESVRNACLNMITNFRYTNVQITNQMISGSVKGVVTNPSEVSVILGHFLHVARLLEKEGARIDGDLGIMESEAEANVESPLPSTSPDGAQALPLEQGSIIDEEEIAESNDDPKEEVVIVQSTGNSGNDEDSVGAISRELLRENPGRSESKRRFEDRFRDREVEWRLTLSFIVPCDDSVFGKDTGWMAVFDPGKVSGGGLQIKYRIGRKRKEAYDREPGSKMMIQGKLVSYDPESCILYIDSGDAKEKANSHSATVIVSM